MSCPLSTQMLTAYNNHESRGETLLRQSSIDLEPELDDFLLVVRNRFFLGVHTAFQETILNALATELRTQQRMAEALGLKDRTSISQMIRSGTMDGIRVTAALYQYPERITLPTKQHAALAGFARATSFLRSLAYRDASIEGSMTPQDFSYLVGVLASNDWDSAVRDRDPNAIRNVATRVVKERRIGTLRRVDDRQRPEQLVLMLQELSITWADFGVIALWAIPECIPGCDENEKVAS